MLLRKEAKLFKRVDDAYTTRRVLWTEPMDDLKKPLGNAVYALQDQSENKADNYEDEFEQNKNASYLDRSDSNNDLESGPGVDESTKGKDPARLARPSRSTAKKISYAEDQDDGFDTVLAIESDAEDDNEGFEVSGSQSLKSLRRTFSLMISNLVPPMARSLRPAPLTFDVTIVPGIVVLGLAVIL